MAFRAFLITAVAVLTACGDSSGPSNPPPPPPTAGFSALAAGQYRTCAVYSGALYCWGGGADQDQPILPRPVRQAHDEPIMHVAAQGNLVCAVGQSTAIYCSGNYSIDNTTRTLDPDLVSGNEGLSGLGVGQGHVCGMAADSTLSCFGVMTAGKVGRLWNPDGPDSTRRDWQATPIGSELSFRQLALSHASTCGITTVNTVACFGDSLSVGSPDAQFLREMNPCWSATMPCIISPIGVAGLTNVTSIAAGQSHTCAVANAAVWCWGANFGGQLGTPAQPNSPSPRPVQLPAAARLIAAGNSLTCVQAQDGKVYCWGTYAGELQQTPPTVVPGDYPVFSTLVVGAGHACGLHDGDVYCWGKDGRFLGNGDTTGVATFTRVVPPPA